MVLRSKNVGFLEFSDSYAKKISGQNSDFFENLVFGFLEKVEDFFEIFFSQNESLDQDLSFGFCFIQIGALESGFWGGVPLLGGGGGLWPGNDAHARIIMKSLFNRWRGTNNNSLVPHYTR